MAKSYLLNFKHGFYWNKAQVPSKAGIYVVYAGIVDHDEEGVYLLRVLYIGQAEDAKVRLANHGSEDDWEELLKDGEEACFSLAVVENERDRMRAERALINLNKPPVNEDCVDGFPHPTTTVRTKGKDSLLKSGTVHRH